MITNIQALRAFAAMAVVLYHTNFRFYPGFHSDLQGVAVFFVISGFIMTYVTNKDDRESEPASFFFHRVIRIVPLYWFCMILLIVVANLGLLNLPVTIPRLVNLIRADPAGLLAWLGSAFHVGTWVKLDEIIKSLFFIPYVNHQGEMHPVLGVGWTLNLEMYFYVSFALMLFFGKRFAPILMLLLIVAFCTVRSCLSETAIFRNFYTATAVSYFGGGITVYYIWRQLDRRIANARLNRAFGLPMAVLGILLFILVNIFRDYLIGRYGLLVWVMPMVLVLSALLLHSFQCEIKNRMILMLGAISYSLYLTHTIVLEMLRTLGGVFGYLDFQKSLVGLSVAMIVSVVAAIFIHFLIERPSLALLRKRFASVLTSSPAKRD